MQKPTGLEIAAVLNCPFMGCCSTHPNSKATGMVATGAKEGGDASKISDSIKAAHAILSARGAEC